MVMYMKLAIGISVGLVGFILFLSSGSFGNASIINEALRALLIDGHQYSLVARVGFSMMIIGAFLLLWWIMFPSKVKKE